MSGPPIRTFRLAVLTYCLLCLAAAAAIVLRGDGPRPAVVGLYPFSGDRFWPGGTAQITFSQAMNHSSVERALQVSPGEEGQGVWYGNTLNLQPVGDWKTNTTYHLLLRGAVVDEGGRPLRTPLAFWFRVHHVGRLAFCPVDGVRNVCERLGAGWRAVTHSPTRVRAFALSPDGTLVAYIRSDPSGLPHLFVIGVDGTEARRLTAGRAYADTAPSWIPGDSSSITYRRRPVRGGTGGRGAAHLQTWTIQIDGSSNSRLA